MISVFMVVAAKKNAENKVMLATYNKQQSEQKLTQTKQQTEVGAQSDAAMPEATKSDPFAELPNHNSQADCWISYDGHIYDISTYFGSHPGGDALLIKYCGADATEAFNTKDREPPRSHSVNATSMLKDYLVY